MIAEAVGVANFVCVGIHLGGALLAAVVWRLGIEAVTDSDAATF